MPLGGSLHHIRFTRAEGAFSASDQERAGLLAKRLGVAVELALCLAWPVRVSGRRGGGPTGSRQPIQQDGRGGGDQGGYERDQGDLPARRAATGDRPGGVYRVRAGPAARYSAPWSGVTLAKAAGTAAAHASTAPVTAAKVAASRPRRIPVFRAAVHGCPPCRLVSRRGKEYEHGPLLSVPTRPGSLGRVGFHRGRRPQRASTYQPTGDPQDCTGSGASGAARDSR